MENIHIDRPASTAMPESGENVFAAWERTRDEIAEAKMDLGSIHFRFNSEAPPRPAALVEPFVAWPGKDVPERPACDCWTRQELLNYVNGKIFAESWLVGVGDNEELVPVPEAAKEHARQLLAELDRYQASCEQWTVPLAKANKRLSEMMATFEALTYDVADQESLTRPQLAAKVKVLLSMVEDGATMENNAAFAFLHSVLTEETDA